MASSNPTPIDFIMKGQPTVTDRRPLQVLIAEDEAIVCMMMEAELSDCGFTVIGPFATCAEASKWLASETPDIAVLDHTLKDGPCTDVALELRRRGIPFVALTGSNQDELPPCFSDVPYLEKPVDAARLPKILMQVLEASRIPATS